MKLESVKIVRFHKIGSPEVLQLDDVPLPEPGYGEVRLRVKAIGLNRSEIHFRQGRYRFSPKLPSKIGYEASGIVDAIGSGVNPSIVGKTFSTVPSYPADEFGVYGEVAVVPATAIAEYPAHLSYEEGAAIVMQYLTAYGGLVREAGLQKQDFVAITAASSSVGIAAIEITKEPRCHRYRGNPHSGQDGSTSRYRRRSRYCHKRRRPSRSRQGHYRGQGRPRHFRSDRWQRASGSG